MSKNPAGEVEAEDSNLFREPDYARNYKKTPKELKILEPRVCFFFKSPALIPVFYDSVILLISILLFFWINEDNKTDFFDLKNAVKEKWV